MSFGLVMVSFFACWSQVQEYWVFRGRMVDVNHMNLSQHSFELFEDNELPIDMYAYIVSLRFRLHTAEWMRFGLSSIHRRIIYFIIK